MYCNVMSCNVMYTCIAYVYIYTYSSIHTRTRAFGVYNVITLHGAFSFPTSLLEVPQRASRFETPSQATRSAGAVASEPNPEGASSQQLRLLSPKAIQGMVFGTENLKYQGAIDLSYVQIPSIEQFTQALYQVLASCSLRPQVFWLVRVAEPDTTELNYRPRRSHEH